MYQVIDNRTGTVILTVKGERDAKGWTKVHASIHGKSNIEMKQVADFLEVVNFVDLKISKKNRA